MRAGWLIRDARGQRVRGDARARWDYYPYYIPAEARKYRATMNYGRKPSSHFSRQEYESIKRTKVTANYFSMQCSSFRSLVDFPAISKSRDSRLEANVSKFNILEYKNPHIFISRFKSI